MGGGPRTFPGGVNKWKWKRMHEKCARDKEKRLLEHEKQLYQARIRSQIRSHLAPDNSPATAAATHGPISPTDHIRAFANRFMKEGAEDLWNDDDGPLTASSSSPMLRQGSIELPVNLRKLIAEKPNPNSMNSSGNFGQRRGYRSVSEANSGVGSSKKLAPAGRRRFWRNDSSSSSESESEDENDSRVNNWDVRKMGSSASLGKHDLKRERRVMPKPYDEGADFAEQVELIKYEINKRKLKQKEMEEYRVEDQEYRIKGKTIIMSF